MTLFKNIGILQGAGLLLAVLICGPISTGYAMMGDDMGPYENTEAPAMPAAEADGDSNDDSNTPMSGDESFLMGGSALNNDDDGGEEEEARGDDGEDMVPANDPNAAIREKLEKEIQQLEEKLMEQALLETEQAAAKEKIKDLENGITETKEQIKKVSKKITQAAKNVGTAKKLFGIYSDEYNEAMDALDLLRTEKDMLESDRGENLAEIKNLKNDISERQKKIVDGLTLSEWKDKLKSLQEQLEKLDA